jgi:hypothetical protein
MKKPNLKTLIKKKKVKKISKLEKKKRDCNSTYWKTRADKAWGELIHKTYSCCLVCGTTTSKLEAHHLISRAKVLTRHNPENGVLLCSFHHKFSPDLSPHAAPLQFSEWLQEKHPDKYEWFQTNRFNKGQKDFEQAYYYLTELIEAL